MRPFLTTHNIFDDDTTTSESDGDSETENQIARNKGRLRTHTIKSDQIHRVSEYRKLTPTMTKIKLNGTLLNVQIDSGMPILFPRMII